ncbi:MAG: hypothetical protein LBI64_00995 [Coriobacteriales bacterium]|nr:hypothetical protein [Coriobacteriales bacterium]
MIEYEMKWKVVDFPALVSKGLEKKIVDTYYDTPQYDLLRQGVFIRRRNNKIDIKSMINNDDNSLCNEIPFQSGDLCSGNAEIVGLLARFGLSITGGEFESFLIENNLSRVAS